MFKNLADDLSILLERKKLIKYEKREMFFHGLQLGDPTKFCVKPNKALPFRQDLRQGKI